MCNFLKDKEKFNKNVLFSSFDTPVMTVPFAKFNHTISLSLMYINDMRHISSLCHWKYFGSFSKC